MPPWSKAPGFQQKSVRPAGARAGFAELDSGRDPQGLVEGIRGPRLTEARNSVSILMG